MKQQALPTDPLGIPIRDLSFVAFDLETTGLSGLTARIVELGAVRISCGEVTKTKFSTLVHPLTKIPEDASLVHGIRNEDVANAPGIDEALGLFEDYLNEDDILVAHNAPYDLEILAFEYARTSRKILNRITIDSCAWASQAISAPNYRLGTLAKALSIESKRFHRAADDAEVTAKIFCFLAQKVGWNKTLSEIASIYPGILILKRVSISSNDITLPEELQDIGRAMKEGSDVVMVYSGGSHGFKERRIAPRTLIRRGSSVYMEAWCYESRQIKTFRIDRIKSARLSLDATSPD